MGPRASHPAARHRIPAGLALLAHRGAPTEQPENTCASFQAALDAGADTIEMDVRTSADGVLVVIHDATVDRVSHSTGAVNALTVRQLQAVPLKGVSTDARWPARIPRLEEVLHAFPQAAMNIDLVAVAASDVPQVFTWIRAINSRPDVNLRVLLTSARQETQQAITRCNGLGDVALGMGRADVFAVLRAAWLRRPPIERLRGRACQMPAHLSILGINVPLVLGPLPAYLKKMGCPLHVWWDRHTMVNSEAQLVACARLGVDGVFTDRIGALVAHPRL